MLSRKHFLKKSFLSAGGMLIFPTMKAQENPALSPAMVKEFVRKAHSDMDKVKELLQEEPQLIYAAHDWGGGDFELGIGSASHVGYMELTLFLLDKGAQMNLFTAAMLGKMEIVRPMLEIFPQQLNARGPHGFTALHHAIVGGAAAEGVKEYLESLGAKERKIKW